MNISSIITPASVQILGSVSNKKRLFQELAEVAADATQLRCTDLCNALLEREKLGPTGVGDGVALPHARVKELDRMTGVFVRLSTPLHFDAADRQPVDLVFALFAPEAPGVEHLRALAAVSRKMRDADLCAKLRANQNPGAIFTLLTEGPSSQAA